MRIAYICADRGIPVIGNKGASIHVQSMARAFSTMGHEVKVLCAKQGDATDTDFDIEQVAPLGSVMGTDRSEKEQAAMATADAIERRLVKLHQLRPFDVIYERYSLWSAAGTRAASKLALPVAVEVNAPLMAEQTLYRELVCKATAYDIEQEVIANASVLAAVSQQMAEYLICRGADAERVHAIGNAVNTELFTPHVSPAVLAGIDESHFVVGFSGSLKMWHGIDILISAFQAFHRECPDSRLLIVGDGPKRGWLEGYIAGANLSDAVHLTGWVPHCQLPGLIARMDIATAPYPESNTHYFSPLKLYEYLAVGRPIVASRIGQTAELLSGDQDIALLVNPGDVTALTKAFIQLHDDPALSRRLAEAAAIEGRQHDWRWNAARIVELTEFADRSSHG